MDWGDNPVVSSMLLKEYRNSADKLADEDVELGDARVMDGETLPQLSDRGFTALMLSRSNISWQTALRRFGMRDLVNFGVDWNMARCMGLQKKHIRQMTSSQLKALNASCHDLVAAGITVDDMKKMGMDVIAAEELGFDTKILQCIGVNAKNCTKLKITPQEWETRVRKAVHVLPVLSVLQDFEEGEMTIAPVEESKPVTTIRKKATLNVPMTLGTIPEEKLTF